MTIRNILNYSFSAGIDFRRQILTSEDGPRAERVKVLSTMVNYIPSKHKTFP